MRLPRVSSRGQQRATLEGSYWFSVSSPLHDDNLFLELLTFSELAAPISFLAFALTKNVILNQGLSPQTWGSCRPWLPPVHPEQGDEVIRLVVGWGHPGTLCLKGHPLSWGTHGEARLPALGLGGQSLLSSQRLGTAVLERSVVFSWPLGSRKPLFPSPKGEEPSLFVPFSRSRRSALPDTRE